MNPDHHPSSEPLEPRWNEFESRLALNRFRPPPQELRDRVLAAACSAPKPRRPHMARSVGLPGAGSAWARSLERWGSGWTVAAAAWGLVWVLNQYSIPGSVNGSPARPPWSDRALAEMRAQQLELRDFASGVPRSPVAPPTPDAEPPRSRDSRTRAESDTNPDSFLV